MLNDLLELAATWVRTSGQRLAEANRLGPGKAGEVKATEAGILKDCADDLRQMIAGGTLRIDAIRRALTVLDTETGSRQYALETIDKIIGDAPGLRIAVEVRDVYGMEKVYPADPTARALADLAGTKTFTPRALATIRRLGYVVDVQSGPCVLPAEYQS